MVVYCLLYVKHKLQSTQQPVLHGSFVVCAQILSARTTSSHDGHSIKTWVHFQEGLCGSIVPEQVSWPMALLSIHLKVLIGVWLSLFDCLCSWLEACVTVLPRSGPCLMCCCTCCTHRCMTCSNLVWSNVFWFCMWGLEILTQVKDQSTETEALFGQI